MVGWGGGVGWGVGGGGRAVERIYLMHGTHPHLIRRRSMAASGAPSSAEPGTGSCFQYIKYGARYSNHRSCDGRGMVVKTAGKILLIGSTR